MATRSVTFLAEVKGRYAKQAYFGARWGKDYDDQSAYVQRETMVINICREFQGWTLEYVREMNPVQIAALIGNIEGHQKLNAWIEHKKAQAQKRAARRKGR